MAKVKRIEIQAIWRTIMALQDDLDAITTQLGKAKDEILTQISQLEAEVAAGQVNPDTVQGLKDAAQALDDINPDA